MALPLMVSPETPDLQAGLLCQVFEGAVQGLARYVELVVLYRGLGVLRGGEPAGC